MSRYDRPTFNPDGSFEARRAFTYNGVKYAPGQSFPWNNIACSHRKLRDLFNGNFITAAAAAVKKAEKKPTKKTKKKVEKVEASSSEAEIKEFLNDQSD